MKSRKLANKLLVAGSIVLLILGGALSWLLVPVPTPVQTQAYRDLAAPSYHFTENLATWETLGITQYNEYLRELSATTALPEVVVAVVDTGINLDDPLFTGRILTQYARNFNPHAGDADAWDFDLEGHGSHIAGLIVDASLPNVKVVPIKAFEGTNNEKVNGSVIGDALNYVVKLKTEQKLNLVAVNLSFGVDLPDEKYNTNFNFYQNYITKLKKNGILPVVAAGNEGEKIKKAENLAATGVPVNSWEYLSTPAACHWSLAVSAYDLTTQALAPWSNYGPHIKLTAPGVDLVSVNRTRQPDEEDYEATLTRSGTSMATPVVTLCYALLMSDASKQKAADFGVTWRNAETQEPYYYVTYQEKALLLGATRLPAADAELSVAYGYGLVNVADFAQPVATTKQSLAEEQLPNYTPKTTDSGDDSVFSNLDNLFWVVMAVIFGAVIFSAFRYRKQGGNHEDA